VEDSKGIYDYISRDSVKYAKIETVRLKIRTNILKNAPFAGKEVSEIDNQLFRELIEVIELQNY